MSAMMAARIGGRLFAPSVVSRRLVTGQPRTLFHHPYLQTCFQRQFSISTLRWASQSAGIALRGGIPTLSVLLPSRGRHILFPMPFYTHRVSDLIENIKAEDANIDKVEVLSLSEEQFALSTSVNVLLQSGFRVIVDDTSYSVHVPDEVRACVDGIDNVKNLVSDLHSTLSVAEQQHAHKEALQSQLTDIREQLAPLEEKYEKMTVAAKRRATQVGWFGLALMSFQAGFLGRLTWWEYSWDIMEPITYFVTYGTAIIFYAYYVVTREDFTNPSYRERQYLFGLYNKVKKNDFDIHKYNQLKEESAKLEGALEKLHFFPTSSSLR